MDDRRPLGSVHHYYFEQVSGSVGTEDEVAGRVRGDLLNDHGVAYGVLGVLQVDAVAERRPEGIHRGIVLQNRPHADRYRHRRIAGMPLWLRSRMPGSRWTSFVADPDRRRILHEDGNDTHRLRVEHDRTRLSVELSGEDGKGPWTVLAVDRVSRLYAVAQAETKTAATQAAAVALTELIEP